MKTFLYPGALPKAEDDPQWRVYRQDHPDEQTGRSIATEKIRTYLSNDTLTVKGTLKSNLLVYRRTDIGYVVIINNLHTGGIALAAIFSGHISAAGDRLNRLYQKIYPDNRIDVAVGKPGYQRVEDETGKILRLLGGMEDFGSLPRQERCGRYLSEFFGMSKKTTSEMWRGQPL